MAAQTAILLVEDEPNIRRGLRDCLELHGYGVTEAVDGREAQEAVEGRRFDLILLDLMLPKVSGEELCQRWREQGLPTPIIMLTAKGQEGDKVAGLHLGADDYVTKPFSLQELMARIEAVLRRTQPGRTVGRRFWLGVWEVDMEGMRIRRDGEVVEVTRREAEMMQFFATNPNRVVSREELYRAVWREEMAGQETRTVDMHIAKLRSKIEEDAARPEIIKTVRGVGYMYEVDGANVP
jgi:two-component system response regulator RegX3